MQVSERNAPPVHVAMGNTQNPCEHVKCIICRNPTDTTLNLCMCFTQVALMIFFNF